MVSVRRILKVIQYIAKQTKAAPNIVAILKRFDDLEDAATWIASLHDWRIAQSIIAKAVGVAGKKLTQAQVKAMGGKNPMDSLQSEDRLVDQSGVYIHITVLEDGTVLIYVGSARAGLLTDSSEVSCRGYTRS